MIDYRPSACLPIVISAPHGGSALPTSIPDRTSGFLLKREVFKNASSSSRVGQMSLFKLSNYSMLCRAGCIFNSSFYSFLYSHTRITGCFEPDELSFELGEEILSEFARKGTGAPAFIALKLHRLKLDANRSRATAANDDLSLAAWDDYHCSIENALQECVKIFDFCLLIDLHGQSHRPQVTELG
jgi:hypothetical protein